MKMPRALPHSPAFPIAEGKDATGHASVELRGAADDPYWRTVYRDMLVADVCFFAKEILGIEIGPHLLRWGDLIEQNKRLAINAARDHSKSTFFSYAYPIWRAWSEPGCEVYIFSNTMEQAQEFLDIIVYGRNNLLGMTQIPELQHLVPEIGGHRDPHVRLNRSDVRFSNGSRIRAVGYGKSIRGRHPKYIVLDDPLNDEDMWSETTRKKNIEYFKSAITNMLPPDGQMTVVGTPYHISDLYGWLRENKRYAFRRFPGIVKDAEGNERALFPWRWKLEELQARREEIGSVSFAREILCEPITDDISIFPHYLFPPLYDMQLKMRPSKTEIEARGWTTYIGVDIARSASVGADYFVVFCIAKDSAGQHYPIDIRRTKGLPFNKQLQEIAVAAVLYDPTLIYIEANAMQQVYTDEMRRLTDLPVKEFVTLATNKYPLDKGVPGLRILMENGKLTIPRGDELSIRLTDEWITECTQFGYIDGKLQGIGEHDDMVMAFWIAVEAARAGGFSFAFGEEDKAGSADFEAQPGDEGWEDVFLGTKEERGTVEDQAFGT
jgi:Terminase RNaseH-like domain